MGESQATDWPFDGPPSFSTGKLPKEERSAVFVLESALGSMHHFCSAFSDALNLFRFCKKNFVRQEASGNLLTAEALGKWQFVAARDGAMSIFHFGEALAGARTTLQQCPSIEREVDKTRTRNAGRYLEKYFPTRLAMRNSVGHAAQISHTQEAWAKHSFSGSLDEPSWR
jgi:hypothetical protein